MTTLKQDMEDECLKLQETLRHLMDDRSFIQDEFLQLTELQQKMMVQLRSDTLAGEGQLHTFQAEKNRIEDRLEQLERQLKEKNDQLLDLDAKASEYLRKVTSVSNNLYDDDDEQSDQNVSQRNLIQKLIKDEMTERSDDEDARSDRSQHGSATDDISIKNLPSLDNDDSEGNEGDVSSESMSDVPSDSKPNRSDAVTPPTRDQIMSLSNLVSELKLVKEEMGRCITNKDETLLELEERLRETKRELASLKGSVSDVSFGMMRHRDEGFFPLGRASSADNRKYELERHVSELQDATGQSSLPHDEKLELLQKIEILESLIDEDNSDLEVDDIMGGTLSRGRSVDPKDFLSAGMLRVRTPSIRSSSVMGNSSISERVAMLEKDLAEANEKLHHAHCHMHVIAKEKEHKQKECERLQSKVHNVEGKMNELQGTFDALVKTMMEEREQLVKEVEDRKALMGEVKRKLEEQKTSVDLSLYVPRAELDSQLSLMEQKYCTELKSCKANLNILETKHADEVLALKQKEEEMDKTLKSSLAKAEEKIKENEKEILDLKNNFKTKENEYILKLVRIQKAKDALEEESNQIQNEEFSVLQTKFDQLQQEMSSLLDKEMSHQATISNLREQLSNKTTENLEFCEKIKLLENEISDFAPHMKEEMARLKDECDKLTEDKLDLEKTYLSLQEELKEVQQKNEELSLRLIRDGDEGGNIAALQKQIEDLKVKNVNLTSEMYTKEEESNEELNAREATIQELRITLTNNQKQSRENYQMLQDDIAAINLRFAKEKEELQAIVVHLKEKCLKLEEDGQQKQQEVDSLKNSLGALQKSSKRLSEEILESPSVEEEGIEEEPVETADKATSIDGGVEHFPRSAPLASSEEVEPEEDYQRLLSVKEVQISELSQKVEYLEKQLLKDSSTSDMKAVATDDDLKSRFEAQMKQIAELNNFIDDLQRKVNDLTSESSKLKETVDQLQTERLQYEEEKKTLIADYEAKLINAKHSQDALESELTSTKALIDECETKITKTKDNKKALEAELEAKIVLIAECEAELSKSKDSQETLKTELDAKKAYFDECETNLNSVNDTKQALETELEAKKAVIDECEKKLSNAKDSQEVLEAELGAKKNLVEGINFKLRWIEGSVLDNPCDVEISLIDRLDMLGTYYDKKIKENNEKYLTKINIMDKQILTLKAEIDEFQLKGVTSTVDISQQLAELEAENKLLKKEIKDLSESHEKEQLKFNENNENHLTKIAIMDKQILALREEMGELQLKGVTSTVDISQQLAELEAENKLLKIKNKDLTESHEKEQLKFNENNENHLTKIAIMDKQILELKEEIDEFQLKDVASTIGISQQIAELEAENKRLKKESKGLLECRAKEQGEFNENNEKYLTKITIMDKQILALKEEIDEFQLRDVANTVKISRQLTDLENENKLLKQEKKSLIESHEKEQTDTLNMQNQMVTDLEKLILSLESEKKELESELKGAQEHLSTIRKEFEDKISVLRESISMLEKERDVLRMEIARLVENQPITDDSQGINSNECLSLIEDLTKKVTKLRTKLEEAQASLEEKGTSLKERLTKERTNHRNEMQRLRKDMREEMDILEQQKEELRIELTNEIKRLTSEWSTRLKASEREKELQLMDEKSQFGRVLVGKNDEYEKMLEEKNIVVSGYEARLNDLQAQLEEKSNLIDELETNIEELVAVRENLEDKLSTFKSSPSSSGKFNASHSPVVKAPKLSPQSSSLDTPLPHHTPPSPHS